MHIPWISQHYKVHTQTIKPSPMQASWKVRIKAAFQTAPSIALRLLHLLTGLNLLKLTKRITIVRMDDRMHETHNLRSKPSMESSQGRDATQIRRS